MLDAKNCLPGQEQYEKFRSRITPFGSMTDGVQYDYRGVDGELFSTIANTLDEARTRRDKWLSERGRRA